MSIPLTIVIPNYNGAAILRKNLPSVIAAAEAYASGTQIIVVDDGSRDESLQVISQEFSQIKTIAHAVNRGFSEAVLTGVKAAETELLFLLNSDVEMHLDCLSELVPYFEDEATFSVNPLMLNEDGSINRHSWNLRSFQRGYLKLMEWNLDEAKARSKQEKLKSLYASGGCMMVRKAMFMQLGGFHPIYKPFYAEDFDLGLRAWYRGWPSYFEPSVHIVHQSLGSIRSNVKLNHVKTIRRRNRYLLEWIHFSPTQLLFSTIPLSLLQLLGELLLLDRVNLKGFGLALLKVPAVLKARKELTASRVLTLKDVLNKLN